MTPDTASADAAPPALTPRVGAGLFLGVLAVSWGALFARLADAPGLSIAAWRLGFASLPLVAWRFLRARRHVPREVLPALLASGAALALHFGTWISSLSFTSVASSVAIVTTTPVWVALVSALWLKERPTRRTLLGLVIALGGSVLIAGTDFAVSARALAGDALALVGAWCAAAYMVLGRRVRPRVALADYVGTVYPVAAACLFAAALVGGAPLAGFSTPTWAALLGAALVPQLLGHSLLNWALKHTTASLVSIAVLGEPVFATLLAIPLLHEVPTPPRLAGGVLVLLGVAVAARGERAGRASGRDTVPGASRPPAAGCS